jgi:hypothetical protein
MAIDHLSSTEDSEVMQICTILEIIIWFRTTMFQWITDIPGQDVLVVWLSGVQY